MIIIGASLVAQMVKNPPAIWETWVWSLGWEDPLEKGTAPHSSILAWRVPMNRRAGGRQSIGSQRVGHDWVTFTLWLLSYFEYHQWEIVKNYFLSCCLFCLTYIILLLSLGLQSWPFTEKKKLFWSCSTEVDHYCMRCLEIIGTN